MKIKLKIDVNWDLYFVDAECTMPIINNRTMVFGAYNVNFEMTDNIWNQLPEEYKRKIYKNNWKMMIKYMLITITDITAYSFCYSNNKQKDSIMMEEIYENFDENKHIEEITTGCDFPYSYMSIYFQNLGEVYAEVELDELVAISDEENSYQLTIMPQIMEASNYRKKRRKYRKIRTNI